MESEASGQQNQKRRAKKEEKTSSRRVRSRLLEESNEN